MNHLTFLIGYVRENPITYLVIALLGTVIGLFELIGIASLLPITSIVLGETHIGVPKIIANMIERFGVNFVICAFLAALLLQAWISFASEAYFLKEMAKWRTKFSIEYVRNILNADFSFIHDLKPGEAEIVITRNVGYAVRNRHRTALFLSDTILAAFYLLIALFVSPYTFILFILLGGVYGLLSQKLTSLRLEYSKRSGQQYLKAAQVLSEYLHDFRSLQLVNKSRLEQIVRDELENAGHAQKVNDVINAGIRQSSQPIILLLGGIGVAMSKFLFDINNSEILVMIFVFYRAAPRMISLARGYGEIIQDSPVDITPEIFRWYERSRKISNRKLTSNGSSGIIFRHVDFSYNDKSILTDVNFEVRPGEMVVFVGRSGSGKSTILDLICGFTRPYKGEIVVWGRDPASVRYEDWLLPNVSLLRPESVVISGSIANNIALLQEAPDRERIAELIQQVGLEEILGINGLDTPIYARGVNLSAGQQQRLLLARALYKFPSLLILDEPTSNLDARTEDDINDLLTSLKGKITILIVTHRRKLLKEADRIFRIEGKTVVPETHSDILLHRS